MGGRASRQKGRRGEYMVRDEFRRNGFESHRVPMSGASQGFKGDVTFTRNGVTLIAEVKCRSTTFNKIYELYFHHLKETKEDLFGFAIPYSVPRCVGMSVSLTGVLEYAGIYPLIHSHPLYKAYPRTFKKIINLQKLLKGADILVLKGDRQPLLYVRFI